MQQLLKTGILIWALVFASLVLADEENHASESIRAVQIDQINYDTGMLWVADHPYHLKRFTVIQRSGEGDDQRLPWSSLLAGQWVLLETEYSFSDRHTQVTRALIMQSYEAEQFNQQAGQDN